MRGADVKLPERTELFRCTALSCVISRGDCAARHRQHARKQTARDGFNYASAGGGACACSTCEIGAVHAAGKLAEVELVQVRVQPPSTSKPVRRCTGCGEPLPRRMGKKGRVTPLCRACGGRGEVGFWEDEQFA